MTRDKDPVEYALGVPGWMTNVELAWLARKAAALQPGSAWLEVGTWMGRSWSCVALSLPERASITCVDDFYGKYAEPKAWTDQNGWAFPKFAETFSAVRQAARTIDMTIHVADSLNAARECRDKFYDAIFLDGDHRAPGVRADLEAWLPKLKPGGLMCGHDIDDPGVRAGLQGRKYSIAPNERGSIWMLDE